jgi:cell division protein FtsB
MITAASYWLHLVHTQNEDLTLTIAQQAREFYSISKAGETVMHSRRIILAVFVIDLLLSIQLLVRTIF